MSESRYTKTVENELLNLARTARERETVSRLKAAREELKNWEDGRVPAPETLENLARLAALPQDVWANHADPGNPVAQAVVAGLLTKEDISDSTWKAIEHLVTLAGI